MPSLRTRGPGVHLAMLRRKAALELILPKPGSVPLGGGSSADWVLAWGVVAQMPVSAPIVCVKDGLRYHSLEEGGPGSPAEGKEVEE